MWEYFLATPVISSSAPFAVSGWGQAVLCRVLPFRMKYKRVRSVLLSEVFAAA